MYGVSKINSEQNIMLTTFPGAQYSAQSLAEHLDVFAKAGIVVDMICQSAPRGAAVDFSFTTSYDNFAAVMKALPAAAKANPPLVSGGYSKMRRGRPRPGCPVRCECRDRAHHDQRPGHFPAHPPTGRGRRPRRTAQGVCGVI